MKEEEKIHSEENEEEVLEDEIIEEEDDSLEDEIDQTEQEIADLMLKEIFESDNNIIEYMCDGNMVYEYIEPNIPDDIKSNKKLFKKTIKDIFKIIKKNTLNRFKNLKLNEDIFDD